MLTSRFRHVYLAISQKNSSWIPQNLTQSRDFVLSKRGNAKTNLEEFFVFKVFLCFEAKHTESNERALPFGFSESLRLPFLLTLAGTCVHICLCLYCRSCSAQSLWSDGQ